MKLSNVRLCVTCDEIVPIETKTCPDCTSRVFLSLARIIKPNPAAATAWYCLRCGTGLASPSQYCPGCDVQMGGPLTA